jgi:hypothetical protein
MRDQERIGGPRHGMRITAARYFEPRYDRRYDRHRDLPRLLPLLTEDLETPTIDAHRQLMSLLKRALRSERLRANQCHWTYDPARHAALARATRIENAALRRRCEKTGMDHRP